MSTSVGQINFGVGVDASGVSEQITRAVTPALKTVQAELNKNPLHIKCVIDVKSALTVAQAQLKKSNLVVKIDAQMDSRQLNEIKAELAALRDKTVTVKVDADTKQLEAGTKRAESALKKLNIPLGQLGGHALKIEKVAAAIAAVGGAAGAAAGAAGGLLPVFAAIGPAVGAVVGTAVVGLNGMSDAFKAMGAAASGDAKDVEKFNEALKKLSPNAQSFVLAVKSLTPQFKELQKVVQDKLFAGLGDQLKTTATAVLPALSAGLGGVADQLNSIAKGVLNFAASDQGVRALGATFASATDLLKGFTENLGPAVTGFTDLITTAQDHMQGLGAAFAGIFDGIGKAFSDSAATGQLDKVFDGMTQALTAVGPLLGDLVTSLLNIAEKVAPSLGPFFDQLGKVLVQISGPLGDLGKTFIDALTPILPVLGDLITALANGLQPLLPIISDLLIQVGKMIQPLIEPFSALAQTIGGVLTDTLKALEPALKPLADAFVSLVQAIAPIIPLIANNLAVVIQALAPPLKTLFDALAPVIKQFTDQMQPVFKQLQPVLQQVAETIAKALVTAINALAPLLPQLLTAFTDLITAIAPFIPQLVDLAVKFIPPVVDILKVLIPVITTLINTFTWLVTNVITPIVMPAIAAVGAAFDELFKGIDSGVDFLTDTVFPKIGDALNSVKGFFTDAIDGIKQIWGELPGIAAEPVNFVIDTVWNNGLLKAWSSVDSMLGGVLPDASPLPLIQHNATGGAIGLRGGSGNGTKDDILSWLSNGEHVVTASEVMAAGGQDILYAIRDMISRGIPFTWDNGKIITDLGRDNLQAYGAAVSQKGIGNVDPQGLFDPLLPKFATGGQVFPWMYQLRDGHDFARAQDGKPYQWAGPQFVGDSFDCSGFMGSIIAAIVGTNPWQRYWSTSTFAGYPAVGAQGLTKGLFDGSGMAVGITDDPGGPGGGHTAGELRGIPELGIAPARVESGGALGNVHYGRGTDPNSFAALYGLPIGANGFFQPTAGGSQNGPSTDSQRSFLHGVIQGIVNAAEAPISAAITSTIGTPPPSIKGLPIAVMDATGNAIVTAADAAVGSLGSALGGAWNAAKHLGGDILSSLNPFDSGGIASGVGFMPKNVITPERVLSPDQTKMFDLLVETLGKMTANAAARTTPDPIVVTLAQASGSVLSSAFTAVGDVLSTAITGIGKDIVTSTTGTTTAVDGTTQAVNDAADQTAAPAFGLPGSSFDLAGTMSDAVKSVSGAVTAAFAKIADDVVNAALKQTTSSAGTESRGVLGKDVSGGFFVDFLVQLTGVEIQVRDLLSNTLDQVKAFRGDQFKTIEATGQIISDTAALVDRNQSSQETAAAEQNRQNVALIQATLKYLVSSVIIPILTAVLSAMITIATTAIGAAIGSAIPVIGTAIGAAIGAAVGAGLSGLASTFVGLLAVGAGAALSSFDEGGLAYGTGFMPKNIIAPERTLSPRQTTAFETLVDVLDRGSSGNRTVQVGSMNVYGRDPAGQTADNLLKLLNT